MPVLKEEEQGGERGIEVVDALDAQPLQQR